MFQSCSVTLECMQVAEEKKMINTTHNAKVHTGGTVWAPVRISALPWRMRVKVSEGSPRVYSTMLASPASLLEPDAAMSRDMRDDVLAAAHSPTVPAHHVHNFLHTPP